MIIDEGKISYISELARLDLNQDEKSEFSKQLSDIISYVEKLNELDTNNVEPADHIVDVKNVMKKDEVGQSIALGEITKNAPNFEDNHFIVPKIIE